MNIPEGWKLVPEFPSIDMTKAGSASIDDNGGNARWADIREAWADMLAAAPTPPVQQDDDEISHLQDTVAKMGDFLRQIVNLIRGEPADGTSHSTHDAVELVRGLLMHINLYEIAVAHETNRLRAELAEAKRDAERHRWLGHDLPSLDRLEAAIERALAEVDRLRTENERLREDAERYRWLRGDSCADHSVRWTQWEVRCWRAPIWSHDLRRTNLDEEIDAAIRRNAT
jgi:hypothetical protein